MCIEDLVTKTNKSDFDQLINNRKESFQNDADEIFDPEEKIFEPSRSMIKI